MAMNVGFVELTIEDILLLHKGWITNLIVEEKSSEVEILAQLHERNIIVTPQQLRERLEEWDLLSSLSPTHPELGVEAHPVWIPANITYQTDSQSMFTSINAKSQVDTRSTSDNWEVVCPSSCSQPSSSSIRLQPDSLTYTSSHTAADLEPEIIDLEKARSRPSSISAVSKPTALDFYRARTLPSIHSTYPHKRKSSTTLARPAKDKLKLTCHHGLEAYEIEMTLGILGEGPSPIETYASDDQSHERIAIGLKLNSGDATTVRMRKASEKGFGIGVESRVKRETLKIRREERKKKEDDDKENEDC